MRGCVRRLRSRPEESAALHGRVFLSRASVCICCVYYPATCALACTRDRAYLLLAADARCVRGRVANCRADPMVASSSAAATDPLLFFAGPGTPPPNSVGFLPLYLRRTASGALRPSTRQIGGAAISSLSRRSGTRWPCSSDQEHLKQETRLRPTLGVSANGALFPIQNGNSSAFAPADRVAAP